MTSQGEQAQPLRTFISYAEEDGQYCIQLKKHLAGLRRQGIIEIWEFKKASAGSEWENMLYEKLDSSNLILLLVSSDFQDSDYCWDVEMKRALKLHEEGQTRVIPIVIRAVLWEEWPLAHLLVLPSNGLPVASWDVQDEAWTNVVIGIRKVCDELRESTAETDQKKTEVVTVDAPQVVIDDRGLLDHIEDHTADTKQLEEVMEEMTVNLGAYTRDLNLYAPKILAAMSVPNSGVPKKLARQLAARINGHTKRQVPLTEELEDLWNEIVSSTDFVVSYYEPYVSAENKEALLELRNTTLILEKASEEAAQSIDDLSTSVEEVPNFERKLTRALTAFGSQTQSQVLVLSRITKSAHDLALRMTKILRDKYGE